MLPYQNGWRKSRRCLWQAFHAWSTSRKKRVLRLCPLRSAPALDAAIACLRQTVVQLAPHLPGWLLHRLEGRGDTLELFRNQDSRYVLYIQYSHSGTPTLCAASRETPAQLARAL